MKGQHYISLGGGVRLLSEEWYIRAFGGRLKTTGFRKLCKALQVPRVQIGREWFVNMAPFEMAFSYVTGLGRPDFLVPGAMSIHNGLSTREEAPNHCRSIQEEDLEKSFKFIVKQLLAARHMNNTRTDTQTRQAIRSATRRMTEASLQLRYEVSWLKNEPTATSTP